MPYSNEYCIILYYMHLFIYVTDSMIFYWLQNRSHLIRTVFIDLCLNFRNCDSVCCDGFRVSGKYCTEIWCPTPAINNVVIAVGISNTSSNVSSILANYLCVIQLYWLIKLEARIKYFYDKYRRNVLLGEMLQRFA